MTKQTRRTFLTTTVVAVVGLFGYQLGKHEGVRPSLNEQDGAPLIGIASLSSHSYLRAVRDSGGIPIVLPNTTGAVEQVDHYLHMLDGLLLPGGADIPPSEYGEEPHETVRLLDDDRFQFEKALSRAWISQSDKPLLGICLGSQWINVSSGGSLVQDIPSEFQINHRNRNHDVILEPDSKLAAIIGEVRLEVNSLHHQAVRDVGENLKVVAHCPNGIVEAIETTDPQRFLIGVQWHPEKLAPEDERQSRLLRAFVLAAQESKMIPNE